MSASEDLSKLMCMIAKKLGVYFLFRGKPITHENVFEDTGLLPAIANRADQLCYLCMGYGLGISTVEAENSKLGVRVQFDDFTPMSMRAFYILDVILEIVKHSSSIKAVSLDEFLAD